MKLGIGSYTFGWRAEMGMTPFELLDEADALGVSVVQIADNMPLDALPVEQVRRLDESARSAGIAVEAGTRGIGEEHLRRYLDLALRLSSSLLRVVVDATEHHPQPSEVVDRLGKVVPAFEAAGVTIAIENHDRFPAVALRQVMRELNSPRAGICLDTANSLGAHEGIAHVTATLAPWVVNVHVKDITTRRLPHLMGFQIEGAPAGSGDLDVPWLVDVLRRDVPRDANVIVELWTPPENDEKRTLAKEARWARQSVEYMRTLVAD